jgi:acetyltransferase-like isoleucine patch superfamily enzyme
MGMKIVKLMIDFVSAMLAIIIYGGAFASALSIGSWLEIDLALQSDSYGTVGVALGVIFYACLWLVLLPGFILAVRLTMPRLRPGAYDLRSPMTLVWTIHLALGRILWLLPINAIVNYFSVLRFVYLRALGCRNSFGVTTSVTVSITDFPLITIKDGAFLGDKVCLSGHRMSRGKLILNKVHIGRDCMVHAFAIVAPGTHMEDRSMIGVRSVAYNCYLEEDAQVQHYSVAAEVRVPAGESYYFLPQNPEETKDPQFEDYHPDPDFES